MAFWRGLQSAIFYYVSCAPCAEERYRKKRRREAIRDRADRAAMEEEMGVGSLYRQPSPSATNPHWDGEIAMGPAMTRGKRKTNTADSQRGLKGSAPQSSNASKIASSVDLPRKANGDKGDGKPDFKHFQREDDELWGSEAVEPPLRSYLDGSTGGDGVTKPQRARTKDSSSYQSYRNPQVSDLHPAIVTKVNAREDVAWMLQPPPVADVMSGKQRPPTRNRSDSGGSRPEVSDSRSLSRQVSNRLVEKKLRTGNAATPDLSRESSRRTENGPKGQRHDRSNVDPSTELRDFAESPSKRAKRRPSPIQIQHQPSKESALTVIRDPTLAPEPARKPQPKKVASRPQLSTILSDSFMPIRDSTEFYTPAQTPKENSIPSARDDDGSSDGYDKTARRSALLVKDDSFKLLQDIPPKTTVFNTKIFAASPSVIEAKARLPADDGGEEHPLSATASSPETFDSWYMPDFRLDQWVHDHTKREVRQRWSMDI